MIVKSKNVPKVVMVVNLYSKEDIALFFCLAFLFLLAFDEFEEAAGGGGDEPLLELFGAEVGVWEVVRRGYPSGVYVKGRRKGGCMGIKLG